MLFPTLVALNIFILIHDIYTLVIRSFLIHECYHHEAFALCERIDNPLSIITVLLQIFFFSYIFKLYRRRKIIYESIMMKSSESKSKGKEISEDDDENSYITDEQESESEITINLNGGSSEATSITIDKPILHNQVAIDIDNNTNTDIPKKLSENIECLRNTNVNNIPNQTQYP
eukprot:jgi/Orpsp1_1/1182747/evm.model.c7180000082535.1